MLEVEIEEEEGDLPNDQLLPLLHNDIDILMREIQALNEQLATEKQEKEKLGQELEKKSLHATEMNKQLETEKKEKEKLKQDLEKMKHLRATQALAVILRYIRLLRTWATKCLPSSSKMSSEIVVY